MAKALQAFRWAGTVSAGTTRGEDLLKVFYDVLQDLAPETIDHQTSERERRAYNALSGTYDNDPGYSARDVKRELDNAHQFVAWLRERLNELAPEGYYFGALEGDAAEYGFWPVHEEWIRPDLAVLIDPYVRALRVQAQGYCPITGVPLDVATAVVVEDADGRLVTVMSQQAWEERREEVLALLPGATVTGA